MKLHALGIGTRHDADFLIDRPNGSGDSLIIIFKTPALIKLNNNAFTAPADSAVVFSPDYHQHYGAFGGEYVNHWVHFDHESDSAFLHRIGLVQNTLITPPDINAAERVLELLSIESVAAAQNSAESTDLLLRLLLTKLADGGENTENSPYFGALRDLRAAIYRSPAEKRTITALAASLSLSCSRFQHLYAKQFGISCYEDILNARHEMARHYLGSTSLSIRQISELCGFDNDVHFMRQFKKRNGATPTEYRNETSH